MQSLNWSIPMIFLLAFFHGTTAYSNSRLVQNDAQSSVVHVSSSLIQHSKIIPSQYASALNYSKAQKQKLSPMRKRAIYDLGLGLNAPIKPVPSANHVEETAARIREVELELDPTRYLVEYEAVRPYPQPMREADPRKKKKSRPVIPTRLVGDDIMKIETVSFEKEPGTEPLAVHQMVAFAQTRQLDPNTAWVEMLISEQQLRHAGIQQFA